MTKTTLYIGIGVVAVAALGALVYFFVFSPGSVSFTGGGSGTASAPSPTDQTPAFDVGTPSAGAGPIISSGPRTIPAGSKEYRSSTYHFSLIYPSNLAVKTYDEGGGATTITFQDIKSAQGFQMFVVPYQGTTISEQRFKQDEPSGVRDSVQAVAVAGVPAVSFYSTNLTLGDTAEVWFIANGYLYEVTSLKPLAQWFSNIMQTWQFI